MIPIIYEKDEALFMSNGLGRLRDCLTCEVTEERNGVFECDFTYPVDGANFDLIQCGRVIAVTHDDTGITQPFDIVSYSKPLNGVVSFHAVHISYRLGGYVVSGTNISTLADALALLSNATPTPPFTFSADFTSSGYMAAGDGTPRTVRSILGGTEGSILDTYGGEYEWDKFNVILHRSRGSATNFKIRYGLNLLEYNEETDYQATYNAVIPFWAQDGGASGLTVVKGDKVTSGLPTYTGREICLPLDLSDKFETKPTKAQLQNMAQSIMQNANLPQRSITVDFVRLQDLGEFDEYESLLQCRLCDTVGVVFPLYNMSGNFKIVKTVYDVLQERFASMELGSLSTTLSEALGISENIPARTTNAGEQFSGVITESLENSTSITKLADLTTLEEGSWVFTVSVRFGAATTGTRAIMLAVDDTQYGATYVAEAANNNGQAFTSTMTFVNRADATVNIYARQNSGAAMNVTVYWRAMRIA